MGTPKANGTPGWDRYCEMLLKAFERDGAVRGGDGEVELPEAMWSEELRRRARSSACVDCT